MNPFSGKRGSNRKLAASIAALLLATASIRAGTITVSPLPSTSTDAATGINTTNIYLCCLAFGSTGSGGVIINSVPFKQVEPLGVVPPISGTDTAAGHGGTYIVTADHNLNSTGNSATGQADGNTLSLLNRVIFEQSSAPVGSGLNQTYGGLSVGSNYVLRLYYRQWVSTDTRTINVSFNGDGTNEAYALNPINEDAGGANYIEYDFVAASTSVEVFMTNLVANGSVMVSGMSLQVVAPSTQNVAPAISFQPTGFTNWAGLKGSLSVGATGTPTPTYQWYQNNSPLSGAVFSVLNFNPLVATNAGSYFVIATNAAGSITSSVVSVGVLVNPITNAISPTLSQVELPLVGTDAATGIGTNNTYLCVLDFSSAGFAGQVNGVTFTPVSLTGATQSGTDPNYGGSWTASTTDSLGFKDTIGSGKAQADGNMGSVLNGASYLGIAPVATTATFSFGGMNTNGTTYALRYYYEQWAVDSPLRTVQFTFNGDGTNANFTADEDAGGGGAYYIEYDFAPTTNSVSLLLTDDSTQSNYGPMIFAITLQETSPTLNYSVTGTSLTLSWNTSITNYALVSAPLVTATTWTPVPGVVNNSVTVNAASGTMFFRLQGLPGL